MERKKKNDSVPMISDKGLMPPHDRKFEEYVLGAMLIDNQAYSRVADTLREEMFYEKDLRTVFHAIAELSREGVGIDMATVSDRLRTMGAGEELALKAVFLTQAINSSAHLGYHVEVLKEMYMCREVIRFCTIAEESAYERRVPVREMLQSIEEGVYNLAIREDRQSVSEMPDMLSQTIKEIEAAALRDGLSGIESGFHSLDKKTSGWQKSDLIILAARPAMGKTALLLSMARNMLEQNIPVMIFSLEMSKIQLMQRLIINATELPASKIKTGKMSKCDWLVMNNQLGKLNNMPLFIDDSANMTIFEMATKARRYVMDRGVKCIFIDYLQLMHADGKNINNREQEVSTISRALKQLAKELDIPIIALSQLNRGVESRVGDNKRPMLSDLRESGAIEQDADMVLLLHRPEYYGILQDDEGNSTRGTAELIIAKNRNGATGSVKLRFQAELIKFSELGDGYYEPEPSENNLKEEEAEYSVSIKDSKSEGEDESFPFKENDDQDDDWLVIK